MRTLVRSAATAGIVTLGILGSAGTASADIGPCVSVADCQTQQEANDGDPNAGVIEDTTMRVTDSFWEDVADFFAGSGWDF
jgi:hypothetical protein